jgi:hypothetical protein
MKSGVHPLRVLLKAILLFVVANILFAALNPPVGRLTLYNRFVPGRLRFPYEEEPSFYFVGYNAPIYEDFDAMFGSHVISRPKPASEFRLILLGDSATWGFGLPPGETLSEQINRLGLQTCDGRTVRAYNLGYPFSYLTRDLLLLDKAMQYQPDMFLWLITLSTLQPKVGETHFILPHAERYRQLADRYDLQLSHFSPAIQDASFRDRTIVGQRKRLKNIALTQAFGVLWAATGIDDHVSREPEPPLPSLDVDADLTYEGRPPEEGPAIFDSLMMDVLSAAYEVAGDVPLVLVNEPIFVATGANHELRYNGFYPRWIYDDYRRLLSEWTRSRNHTWLDYWNALPVEGFNDMFFHRKRAGEARLAGLLAADLQKLVCP